MSLEPREVTKATVREVCALEVHDEQRGYVASNALSIAQAYFEPSAVFRAVYLDGRAIGFVQWREADTPDTVVLWRFMIDRRIKHRDTVPLPWGSPSNRSDPTASRRSRRASCLVRQAPWGSTSDRASWKLVR